MNKEEILEKSRQENKNRDISEISQTKDASRFAIIFSLAFYIIYSTLTMIAHKPLNKGIAAMETCVMFAVYLHKSIKTKKANIYYVQSLWEKHFLCSHLWQ